MQLSHFSTATTTCPNHRTMLLSSLSTAHFPLCSKLATIFKYGLIKDSVPQNVFMLHQHMRFLKRGNEKRLFTNSYLRSRLMTGGNFAVSTTIPAVASEITGTCDERCVCFV